MTRLYHRLWTDSYIDKEVYFSNGISEEENDRLFNLVLDNHSLTLMHRLCESKADEIILKNGLARITANVWSLSRAVAAAMQRASLVLENEAQGIFEPGTEPTTFGSDALTLPNQTLAPISLTPPSAKRVTISKSISMKGLVEAWWREAEAARRKPSTAYRRRKLWRRVTYRQSCRNH